MPAFKNTRIRDVAFSIDKKLNVINANRNFANLFDVTDVKISIEPFMDVSDARNLKNFLSNIPEAGSHNFVLKLFSDTAEGDFIFETERTGKNSFFIKLYPFELAKENFDQMQKEILEFSSVLKTFERYYFVYDGQSFELKHTRLLTSIFRGSANEFKNYIATNFNLLLKDEQTAANFAALIFDIQKLKTKKTYDFLIENNKKITVLPKICQYKEKQIVVGTFLYDEEVTSEENLFTKSKDGLTDLFNKKAITEQAIHKINVLKEPCSLIILDIDKFKEFNDTFGHAYGDKVIIAVAGVIKDALKKDRTGIAGRIGGDEFLLILNTTEEEEIRKVTRGIRLGINWAVNTPELSSVVTCSMGVARSPLNATDYDSLFSLADKCLYIAKNKGRNCYIIYKPEIHDAVIIKNEKEKPLNKAGMFYNADAQAQQEILDLMYADCKKNLKEILEKMLAYMEISQITLYKTDEDGNFELALNTGKKHDFRTTYLNTFKDEYFYHFNSYNFLHLDNTTNLDTVDKRLHSMYAENNVSSIIEYVAKDENENITALICYDIYKPARTFAKEKVVFAILVAKFLTNSSIFDMM